MDYHHLYVVSNLLLRRNQNQKVFYFHAEEAITYKDFALFVCAIFRVMGKKQDATIMLLYIPYE